MKKKLQIFVSSTFEDLKIERQLVMESILELGHLPAGMEYFVSDIYDQFEIIKRWIKESDAYILIVGGRYGSINLKDPDKRSYTHMEYDYAHQLKKPIRIIRLSKEYLEEKKTIGIYTDNDLSNPKLVAFRNNLKLSNNVNSKDEIKNTTKILLNSLLGCVLDNTSGWIKLDYVSDLISLHPYNKELSQKKLYSGNYHVYYHSKSNNRTIHSLINFDKYNAKVIFKNDIRSRNNPMYTYKGRFDIYDDFLYFELKSVSDNEKVLSIIRLLPGKLKISLGIILAQGTSKQAVATNFVISKQEIKDNKILEKFRNDQISLFNKYEKLVIDDDSISNMLY